VPEPIAIWNPARGAWETAETNLLCGHSALYSGTWPASGSMRNGRSYPPLTPGHLTAASGSSSSRGLLPTPMAGDAKAARNSTAVRHRTPPTGIHPGNTLTDILLPPAALLKTPTAQLAVNGGSQHPDKRRAGGHGPTLADQIEQELTANSGSSPSSSPLLPTPTAQDARHGWNHRRGGERASEPVLQSIVHGLATGPLDYGLLPSGGHIAPPSADGKPSSVAPLPGQLSLDELAND
jgi:hypothetical protein